MGKPMGFAATASDFEERANRARDEEAKAHVIEIGVYYRKLAGSAPDFPPGFDGSKSRSRTDRWRERAEACRAMAEHFKDCTCRDQMNRLADTYDKMAVAAE